MRIQNLNNAPTFGYNKKLNKELIKRLENDTTTKPALVQTMQDLNKFCNNTEDMLVANYDDQSRTTDLLYGTLSSTKLSLANLVDQTYPDLKYTSREYEQYMREANKNVEGHGDLYDWRFSMAAELGFLLPLEETLDEEELNELNNNKNATELTDEQWSKLEKAENLSSGRRVYEDDDEAASVANIVERFKPTYSSPTGFESLGGMENLKEDLYDKIIYPILHPHEAQLDLEEYGKRYPRGIMLYGPPGCGKTFILEALAQEANVPLFKLQVGKAGSKFINQTSNNYQKVFDYVAEYGKKNDTPCILFIDEVDGFTKSRSGDASDEDLKQVGTLLNLIETARDRNIIVVAATNKYDIVDEAIRRRFDSQVYVGMPDFETREAILYKTLSQWLKGIPLAEDPDALREIAAKTIGFPSSALVILSDKASTAARKDGRRPIQKEDYFKAIEDSKNLKIDERKYFADKTRPSIGFNQSHSQSQSVATVK